MSVQKGARVYEGQIIRAWKRPKLGSDKYLDYVDQLARKDIDFDIDDYKNIVDASSLQIIVAQRAIKKIMLDVNNEDICDEFENIKKIPYEKPGDPWRIVCLQFNKYITKIGSVSKQVHYFRNKLNRYPETLDEMLKHGTEEEWELYKVGKSIYHMLRTDFSDTGLKNLKFVCRDGIFEAVYNHEGKICDEDTDPANMGTYNYIKDGIGHGNLDVMPYHFYGNVPGVPSAGVYPDSEQRYNYVFRSATIDARTRRAIGPKRAESLISAENEKNRIKANEAEEARAYRADILKKWTGKGDE